MRRLGKSTLEFDRPTILSHGAVGGKREAEGPLGGDFDQTFGDTTLQEESWEKAEARLQKEAVTLALGKAGLSPQEVDFILAGDLLNQCISSTFGLLDFGIPFLGQYGACSTMAQTLLLASILEDLLLGTGVLVYVFLALLLGGIAWVYLYSWLVYIGKMK